MIARDKRHDEILRRMAEPEDLRELRRQAERIERERRQAGKVMFDEFEKAELRAKIRAAGEIPCR